MQMIPLPCKQCIVFVRCKVRVNRLRCPLLYDYLYKEKAKTHGIFIRRLNQIHKHFKRAPEYLFSVHEDVKEVELIW